MKNALDLNQVATLSTVLISNLDENVFFSKISEFVMNTFGEYKVLAFEAFQDGATELRAENGKIVENGLSYEKGQGLSGYVVRMKRAYYSNSQRDPLLSTSKRDDCVVSELSVPVTCDGTVIGTIHVQSSNEDRKFSEEDVTIITNLLNELDAVVRNMKMYLIAKNLNKQLLETIEAKNLELSTRGPELKSSINKSSKIDIIGRSNSMVEVLNIAKSVAKEDFPVFIQGPSGTGKKLLAKQIHSLSERAGVECSTVHCSAIQDSQLEVELFGIGERAGLLERSNGGTILLDSVDELSLNIQGKLLRAITSGESYRVDSNIPSQINVRFISMTNKPISDAIEAGTFREDLLYRLNIVGIKMPSLSERNEDIKILAEYFLNLGKEQEDYKILTNSAVEKLVGYNWPGNIQELRNIMERTYILVDGRYVDEQHLPELVKEEVAEVAEVEDFTEMTIHDLEKIHITKTLEHLGGNKTRAAKTLGITVKTLYNKLHSYGLVHPKAV